MYIRVLRVYDYSMSPQFVRDRSRSKIAPQLIKTKLEQHGWQVYLVRDGYFPDYDFTATKGQLRFTGEIKMDFRASETGNVCLEVEALSHSKASMLFFCTTNKAYMMPLQEMLSYARLYPNKKTVGEHGEQGALIPIQTFESLSFVKRI
jgi:hypothetical protein